MRFSNAHPPLEFYNDWLSVLNDEAKHFLLLFDRLSTLGATYGDLPAHDGLWEVAQETSHDTCATCRCTVGVRGSWSDVTPQIISSRNAGDTASVAILEVIYREEISHVAVGRKWFEYFCDGRPEQTWQRLVKKHFRGSLKPPFNVAARSEAGFNKEYYGDRIARLVLLTKHQIYVKLVSFYASAPLKESESDSLCKAPDNPGSFLQRLTAFISFVALLGFIECKLRKDDCMLYSETEPLFREVNEGRQNRLKHSGRRLGAAVPVAVHVGLML